MKPSPRFIILILCCALFLTNCGRRAIDIDRHFIGVWDGHDATATYKLTIDPAGMGYWQKNENGYYTTGEGLARIKHNHLHIGTRTLIINQYPTYDSTSHDWTMILSGVKYIN